MTVTFLAAAIIPAQLSLLQMFFFFYIKYYTGTFRKQKLHSRDKNKVKCVWERLPK